HQPAFGIQGDVVPAVAAALLAGLAVFLLLGDERPLLIQLHFLGRGGKKPPARRGLAGRACRPAGQSGPPCLYRRRSGVPSGGPRSHPGGVGRRRGPGRGEPGGEQGGALALGESLLARAAGEHPPLVLAVAEADPEVAFITQAVVGAIRVLTTKQGK